MPLSSFIVPRSTFLPPLLLVALSLPAPAASTISLGTSTITYPGGSFTLNVSVTATIPFSQLDLYLVAPNAPAKSFTITSRNNTWNGPITNPLTFPNTDTLPANYPLPPTGNSLDLGYSASDTTTNINPGAYTIEQLHITANTTLPSGNYSISTVTGLIGTQLIDASGTNTDLPAATFPITITKPGDANLDAHVDLTDLSIVLNNFGVTTPNWTDGNFDHQPTIDLTDLSDVLNNFGSANPNASAAQLPITNYQPPAAPAPEPASLFLLAPITLLFLSRRRKPSL